MRYQLCSGDASVDSDVRVKGDGKARVSSEKYPLLIFLGQAYTDGEIVFQRFPVKSRNGK